MAVSAAFLSAFEAHKAGHLAEAERGYRAVLAAEPRNADAWHLLGLIGQAHGNLAAAAGMVEKALEIGGPNADFLANLGIIYDAQKRSGDAVPILQRAIALAPKAFAAHFALGNSFKNLGRVDEALTAYRAALALDPKNPSVYNNMGGMLQDAGRLAEAIDMFRKAVALQPNHGSAHYNLGVALKDLGRGAEAADSFRRAMALLPDLVEPQIYLAAALQDKQMLEVAVARARAEATATPDGKTRDTLAIALNELAMLHKRRGGVDIAAELFDSAVARSPNNAFFRTNLGNALVELDRAEEAEPHMREAARLAPGLPETHYNLGNALKALERADEAIACYEKAIALRPAFTKARQNLGDLLRREGRFEEALRVYDDGVRLDTAAADLWDGRGVVLQSLGRVDEALESFRTALRINPEAALAHRNAGVALLTNGQFAEGWQEYAWRFNQGGRAPERFSYPAWQGERDDGGILVWGEQGVGDRVLYAGMIPDLLAQGRRVIVEAEPRLQRLFARSFPGAVVVAEQEAPENTISDPGIRWQSALANLGRYLRTDAASFPKREAYLRADPDRAAAYRAHLDTRGQGPIIGVSWGSRSARLGQHKTLDLKAWAPVLQTPGIRVVDLQYGDTAEERTAVEAALGVSIIHVPDLDLFEDIDGAAALTVACDLVISISNTAVHLAAALGKPTWVLVPAAAGNLWYWMRDTERSPWYPSATIIRQKALGKWDDVMRDVKARLDQYLAAAKA